ncbi:hypothetical protein [Wenzhouxiangella marina]|uniref:Uncharacterized protein n=1 Tax=Wenzhouxiangella marina TaxID=1579979 RepID=A0A0K0XUL5_9GAMM|nr:hypothetical protein [Wenzhouxiangella marina]AKS41373.1 hypothetical protein WM2015_996 [Wenzhouxiangella marina]MBB6086873.1 hypothetical protein [Wenzhouxiangella marina]
MSDAFEELAGLWARRDALDEAEWTRLHALVMAELAAAPPGEEFDAVLSRENASAWRDSFFADKVLMPAIRGNAAMSRELTRGGLRVFYRNYLRDQLRKIGRRREVQGYEGAEDNVPDAVNHNPAFIDPSASIQASTDLTCPIDDSDGDRDGNPLQASAIAFMRGAENWVVVYLALHFCGGRDRLPLSKVHQQFQIPSYHYKARQLGIAPPRGGFESFSEFGETMIGQWLSTNGIELDEDNIEAIRQAFDRLCLAAFHEARDRGLAEVAGMGGMPA